MNALFGLLSEQTVVGAIQLMVGGKVKKWAKGDKRVTALIPWFTLLLSYIGFTVMPVSAQAATSLGPLAPQIGAVVGGLVQTVMVTGTHGFYKNALKPVLKTLLGRLLLAYVGEEK